MCDTVDAALQDFVVLFRGLFCARRIIKLHANSHLHSDRHSMLRDTYTVFNYAGVKLGFILLKSKFNVIDAHLWPRSKMQWYNIQNAQNPKNNSSRFSFSRRELYVKTEIAKNIVRVQTTRTLDVITFRRTIKNLHGGLYALFRIVLLLIH